jgi:long-subunit fatty acid transport protein
MKQILLASTILVAGTSTAFAGGMEVGRFNPSFMFQSGNYAELSVRSSTPDVTDDTFSPDGSMLGKMTNTSASVKVALNDRLSIGVTHYDAARIKLDYADNGGPFTQTPHPVAAAGSAALNDPATQAAIVAYVAANPGATAQMAMALDAATQQAIGAYTLANAAALPKMQAPYVNLSYKSTALVVSYAVNDQIDVFGGIKYSAADASGDVVANPAGDIVAKSGSDTAPVLGVSYSKPEIALRVTAMYQGESETSHETSTTFLGTTTQLQDTKAALPESFTLDFQTGIAPKTLLLGSIHHARWDDAHIYFDGSSTPKSSWQDSTTYSVGVGRAINENWAVSASINYEAASESAGTSLLSVTDGTRGVTLGARYTRNNMNVSLGVNYTQFGDKTVTTLGQTGEFKDNSITTVGLNIGYSF